MPFRATLVLLALGSAFLGSAARDLAAQEPPAHLAPVQAGARVRLRSSLPPGLIEGDVLRITPDSVEIGQARDRTTTIALRTVSGMERRTGRSRLRGAGIGLATGIAAGGGAVAASVLAGADLCIYVSCLRHDPAGAMGGFLIGAVLGAPIGALLGAIVGAEVWVPVNGGWSVRAF